MANAKASRRKMVNMQTAFVRKSIVTLHYATPLNPTLEACDFYHTVDLPNGEHHDGHWDLRGLFDVYTGRVPLSGKTFLDVGTASGYLSFMAEAAGATVTSFDASEDTPLIPIPWTENGEQGNVCCCGKTLDRVKNGYWYCHRAFNSKAKAIYRDVHAIAPDMGQFDVVIAGCILLHLVDPIGALMKIAQRAKDTLIITELDPYDLAPQPVLLPNFTRSHKRSPEDFMSWWQFPPEPISMFLDVIGFKTESVERFKMQSPIMNQTGSFYSLVARRR
jgi:SAM-dependent methyltransferase